MNLIFLTTSRTRKVRCDGVRPTCTNCTRRDSLCDYDPVAKRRGPDRRPGTRQRSANGRDSHNGQKSFPNLSFRSIHCSEQQLNTVYAFGKDLDQDFGPSRSNPHDIASDALQPHQGSGPSSASADSQCAPPNVQARSAEIPVRPRVVPSQPRTERDPYRYPFENSILANQVTYQPQDHRNLPTLFPVPGPSFKDYPPNSANSAYSSSSSDPNRPSISTPFGSQEDEYARVLPTVVLASPQDTPFAFHISPPDAAYVYPSQLESTTYPPEYSEICQTTGDERHSASIAENEDISITREPSLRFTQETWWDTVLEIYNPKSKALAITAVNADILTFFRYSPTWMSCINLQLFFNMFHHEEHRRWMQPSLVLSLLAFAAYIQGSEIEGGDVQRRKASHLRQVAQSAFDASYNAGWLDVQLGQAAFVCIPPSGEVNPK